MYERFIDFIETKQLLNRGDRVLLAVSGGPDSMSMLRLFSLSPYSFAIAHCNFQLRGREADEDEAFVKACAGELNADFFSKRFETASYAKQHKLSLQMAARTLRYDYLKHLQNTHGFRVIATAHHIDDSIETLFINLIRGTGIAGLKGIPVKAGDVIRPLMFATRKEIIDWAHSSNIRYREDASNKDHTYLRNRIRHQLIPVVMKLNPSAHDNMQVFFERMEAVEAIYKETVSHHKKNLTHADKKAVYVKIQPLLRLPYGEAILYELLKEYGFSFAQSRDVFRSLNAPPGAQFLSASHQAIKDREHLVIVRKENTGIQEHIIGEDMKLLHIQTLNRVLRMEQGMTDHLGELEKTPETLTADLDKLVFPLTLRSWKPGDKLTPFGMSGQKKISDILIDKKIPVHEKQDLLVLVSAGTIVWMPGICSNDNFKITKKTKRYFKASWC